MKDIINEIKYRLIPKFLRYIKENNDFPYIINKKIWENLPYDTKLCMARLGYDKEVYNLYDICEFEVDFFYRNDFSRISPFGKNNKQCKDINDKLNYIMYFIISDILNKQYLLKINNNKRDYVKNIVKIINN